MARPNAVTRGGAVGTAIIVARLVAAVVLTWSAASCGNPRSGTAPQAAARAYPPPAAPPRRSIETLIVDVQSSDRNIRLNAIRDLGKAGPAAVDPLIPLLRDHDESVRAATADALGLIADPRAVAPLIESLRDPRLGRPTYGEAALALIRIGAPAVAPLIAAANDRAYDISLGAVEGGSDGAVWALGKIKDPRVVPALLEMVKTDRGVVINGRLGYAVSALSAIGDPGSIPPLVAELKRPPGGGRIGLINGLADFGAPAVEPLIAALGSPYASVRQGAADALGRMCTSAQTNDPRAVAALNGAMAARNHEIVSAAYYYFAQRKQAADDDFLIRLLMQADRREGFDLASYGLNFGTPNLRAAAEQWAHSHGVRIVVIQE